MQRVASGYTLAEAPVAAPDGGFWFSDVLGGGVYRWSPTTGEVETVLPKRRGIGGMALHADGGLVMSGRDVIHWQDGESRTLYTPPDGVAGINDLTVDPDGRVVVGQLRFHPFAGETPVDGEFVRLDGSVVLPGVRWANGCAFSPDGATFYGCDYERGLVLAVTAGDAPRVVVESPSGDADGMAVDEDGCLWVALGSRPSVGRFTPDGVLDSEVEVDADFVASVGFFGSDRRDLVITTTGDVFVTRASVAGLAVPAALTDAA